MTTKTQPVTFRVLDAMPGPHGGRILRLRLQSGETPSISRLKGARMTARSPDQAAERHFRIDAFAVFGGKPSDERLRRTGRVDVHVTEEEDGAGDPISLRWEVVGPLP